MGADATARGLGPTFCLYRGSFVLFFLAGERVKSMEEWIDQASRRLYNAFEEFLKHNCRIYSRDWQKSAVSNDVGKSIYISNSPPSSMPLSSSSAHKPLEW